MRELTLSPPPAPVSPAVFRSVMGSFPTGVTVITTTDGDATPVGMTVNAITSVSLEPPQLLICLARQRYTAEAIRRRGAFAVNFMGADQKETAALFASKAEAKFEQVDVHTGEMGLPLITGSLALAECEVIEVIEAGDHLIFIGEVKSGTAGEGLPLMFFRRNFGAWGAGGAI